jgi:uncharacterized protein
MSVGESSSRLSLWQPYEVVTPQSCSTEQPVTFEVVMESGLRIPMRDGTELVAMLWRPNVAGRYPALVERGPMRLDERTGPAGEYYAARGYIVVGVALRGCSGSGGKFLGPMLGAASGDGYDTVEWVAAQPWCDGRVGMICGSITGFTAYQTAVEAPPHLEPLFVREGVFGTIRSGGGTNSLMALQGVACAWTEHQLAYLPHEAQDRGQQLVQTWHRGYENADARGPFEPVFPMLQHLPLYPHPLFRGVADYYNDWLVAPNDPGWWESAELERKVEQVQVPICHLGGWFDGLILDTLTAFMAMQSRAKTEEARKGQRLIVGPWIHGPAETHGKPVGLLEFGPNARLDFYAFRQRWYDAHLRHHGSIDDDPAVWLYLVGPDRWLGFETWPPPQTRAIPWYLHKNLLAQHAPEDKQNPDSYEYDPNDPVPTLASSAAMGIGLDQRPIEQRLLTYTSSPLDEPLTLVGPARAVLYAASSAPDTDWIVKLTMVRPDGASVIISGGVLRARFRHSLDHPAVLEPNKPERFEIGMMPLSIVIPAGDRLRLTITSSDFPAIDRNLNTGGPIGLEARGQPAMNSVYHDPLRASHVLLPVFGEGMQGEHVEG